MKTENRKDWQADPTEITTGKVTLWSAGGVVVTAMLDILKARAMVANGRAFVISHGHIGTCD